MRITATYGTVVPISAKTMARRYPFYFQELVRDLIDAQNADQSDATRHADRQRGKPSDSVTDGLFRVIMSGAGPVTGRAIRRYRGFMSPDNASHTPQDASDSMNGGSFNRDDPPEPDTEATDMHPMIDLYARFKALSRVQQDMQAAMEELRLDMVRIMEKMQESTTFSAETITPESVHSDTPVRKEDIIRTVQLGIIPANVTEQAWPMLLGNLQKAGVPVPEVDTWITDETYDRLSSLFHTHCEMLHVHPQNSSDA